MYLTLYKPTEIELWISQIYQKNGIRYASDMDIDHIADIFNASVRVTKDETRVLYDDHFCLIFLHAYFREEQKREAFFHELCHPIMHVGNQHRLPAGLMQLQEIQAANFQLYAAMPAYMLEEFMDIKYKHTFIKVLSGEFKLPLGFVQKRIDQIERRILQERMDQEFIAGMNPVHIRYDYTPETQRILTQLKRQVTVKTGVIHSWQN